MQFLVEADIFRTNSFSASDSLIGVINQNLVSVSSSEMI